LADLKSNRRFATARGAWYVPAVSRGRITLACACWTALAAIAPAVAHAYEDELTLGVGLGYANAVSNTLPQHGALFDLAGSVGLSNVWTLRGRLSYAFHPDDRPLHVGWAGIEMLYLIDVVEVVPYFGLGVDGFGRDRNGDFRADAASHVVVGLDYLVSRTIALELDVRAHVLWTAISPDRDPFYLAATASVIWMFDR
jgi:hypothetical protein